MISFVDIDKAFGGQVLLNKSSFQVNFKERVGIIGRNGSGKTTVLKLITGQEYPDDGQIQIPKNYSIGYLGQHREFKADNILQEVTSAMPPEKEHESWYAEKIICGLGFSGEDLTRKASEFSSGYQIRISLAMALASQPRMLLLDEPTNYLDIISIRWLSRFLKNWDGEVILVTHDRHFMDSIATHIISIHRQKMRKMEGNTGKILEQIQQEEIIHEKTRSNEEKKRKQEELFISRFRAKARLAGMVQSRIKALDKREKLDKLDNIKDLLFKFNCVPSRAKYLVNLQNINFGYSPGDHQIIDNFSLDLGSNEKIAVIGKNGRGKSTLLKLIYGELAPQTGELIKYQDLKMGFYSDTSLKSLNPDSTIEDEILYSDPKMDKKSARDICGLMMFQGDKALKQVSILSGGEKSRVCLGKLILSPCNLLLLDEPTNHLDQESCEALIEAIKSFQGSVILVTHNERFLEEIPSRLVVFDDGKIRHFMGKYADFLSQVGWSDEKDITRHNYTEDRSEGVNKKELRKQKAEIQKRKSAALGPLKKKMSDYESRIMKLEKKINGKNQALIEASEKGDGKLIPQLSADIKDLQWKTDELYNRLDSVTTEFEEREMVFNQEIEQLEE